jgi:hypothetical protein
VEQLGEDDGQVFEVWEENAPAIGLFVRLSTQWKVSAMGRLMGIDYTAAESVMRMTGARKRRALLDDLRVMESAVLEHLRVQA